MPSEPPPGTAPQPRLRLLLSKLVLDVRPLREVPAFRRLWAGGMLSSVGGQMTYYAVLLQVFRLTHSSFSVGIVGLSVAIPAVTVAVLAGGLVDSVDRRMAVLLATSSQVLSSSILALQAFMGLRQVWLLYLVVAVQAGVGGINAPARRTFMPNLLRREQLAAGAALQSLAGYVSFTAGPALAGVITAAYGLKVCYVIDAASFGFSIYSVARLPSGSYGQASGRPAGLRSVLEGLGFVFAAKPVLGALLADMSATILGMPISLFPAINAARFGGDAETLGLMSTALAVGGLVGSALSGPVARLGRQGLGMLLAEVVFGAGLVGFALAGDFALTFLALGVAGAADVSAVVLRTALVQGGTPDELRGRVSAAEYAVGSGMPQLGNFRAGILAAVSSPEASALIGGLSTIAAAFVIGAGNRQFRRADARSESPLEAAV